MADVLHMRPNLVGTTGFEYAAHQRNRAKAFQHLIVRHSGLTILATRVYGLHLAVAQAATNMTDNRARGAGGRTPHQRQIAPLDGMVKELIRQVRHGKFRFTDDQ